MKMSEAKRIEYAKQLISLLEEYISIQDSLEKLHNREDFMGKVPSKSAIQEFQRETLIPFMQKCVDTGFKYVTLVEMIPGPPSTSSQYRKDLLREIRYWVKEEFGIW